MTAPDVVFAEFVQANPVPDVADLAGLRPEVTTLPLSDPAAVDGWASDELVSAVRQQPPRRAWLAAAALLSVIVIVGVVAAWPSQPGVQVGSRDPEGAASEVAEPQTAEDALRLAAVAAVEEWIAALDAGDIDRVLALSGESARSDADRRMYEWLVAWADAGLPVETDGCEAASMVASMVRVECDVRLSDPVAGLLGLADLVGPFDHRDGLVTWQPWVGGDIGELNNAWASYLRTFHPAAYEAQCSPAAYEPGTVVASRGLALTADCAELAMPLAEDVADWVAAGMPDDQP